MASQYPPRSANSSINPAHPLGPMFALDLARPLVESWAAFYGRAFHQSAVMMDRTQAFMRLRADENLKLMTRLAECTSTDDWQAACMAHWRTTLLHYQTGLLPDADASRVNAHVGVPSGRSDRHTESHVDQ